MPQCSGQAVVTLDPRLLGSEPALLEEIEKATLRMVTQAILLGATGAVYRLESRTGGRGQNCYDPD